MILHSVFFYLKEQTPSEIAGQMEADIKNKLSDIPSVNSVWAGPPEGVERDVVDNDYQTSLHAMFDDIDALQSYQVHPVHVTFVETYKPYFSQIKVFDTRIS